ncbi:DUF676-domain-containing protein [Cutaneotrichosporon oleaginosum]|uniref:DUF676-domain-containing protein n=1 Tax=Cutaneotrichosporon oleaginosum TaxID=879819 RepID=A0A0J0XGD9_9TREE|nr:DUF676-domain-containing protein [Cutaneotrichosporon oleaginosum]KLT40165.1 DUF676-domain-containing protein [Cutaneotrichosporon oleaginosum]TXT06870.1 hypothetical protein COLE_06201 [Cutaneotrichosporon oleaginosum]
MPDVHLFLLIHGLWGHPFHLAQAKAELEAAWHAHTPSSTGTHGTPGTPDGDVTGAETTPLHTSSVCSSDSGDTMVDRLNLRMRPDLVVVVAEGMTAMLTYDGVDVCASRVAWEVDEHIAEIEHGGRRVTHISILGYSLGGMVARYLVGLLEARTPSFFDKHIPVSFTTIATPHLGVARYNTLLSNVVFWLGARLLSRSGEQMHLVDTYSEMDPRPLLEVMADPKHVWHQALARFDQVHVYANTINDNTVPFPSAAIASTDPFVQWTERGLDVDADDAGIVSHWRFPHGGAPRKRKVRFHLGSLPPTLRFRWPYSWMILALFPIVFPILALFVFCRFSLDTRRSRLRLQRLARSYSDISPESGASPIPSPHGLSIDALRAAIRAVERSLEQDLMEAADAADTAPSPPEDEPDSPAYPEPTIKALLSDSQHRMVYWLNQLEPTRHLAWFPGVANAHAVIVVRDPAKFAVHERGRGVLQHWARVAVHAAEEAVLVKESAT